jgi:capsular polysaccharide biosynthesis protein
VSDADQRVSDEGETIQGALNGRGRLADRLWAPDSGAYDEFAAPDERFGGAAYPGLVSLGFIQAAIRRTARIWCTLGLVGLLAGAALFVVRPAGYLAETTLLLSQPPGAAAGWINDDQVIAQNRVVAARALLRLGLKESPASFVQDYTVVAQFDRLLQITVKAPSQQDALRKADALAAAFLGYQQRLLNQQENLVETALQERVTAARQHLAQINARIAKVQAEPSSLQQQQRLHALRTQSRQATSALTQLRQTVDASQASAQTATATAVNESMQLGDAALVKQSVKRRLALFMGGGLLAGLAVGLGIVIVTAIVSNRLRRRDDVARTLGAPVRLSVRKGSLRPRRLRRQGLAAAQGAGLSRIVRHLGTVVAPTSGGFASLAVVPVDDAAVEVAAISLASLAMSSAKRGLRVVLVDLCSGAPGARVLGVRGAGVGDVRVGDVRLVVAVPDREDVPPAGPLRVGRYGPGADDREAAACRSAELVLTLAPLDPAFGGDYLGEWASSVVAVVTAGQSTAERIHAVGEMIRLGGIPQASAVLVGSDKTDESLGVAGLQGAAQRKLGPDGMPADTDLLGAVSGIRSRGSFPPGDGPAVPGRTSFE